MTATPPRRRAWRVWLCRVFLFLVALAAAWGFLVEPGLQRTVEVDIESSAWPAAREPIRIVAISDLHVGSPHNGLDALHEAIERANSANPHLVVLLGDYVQNVLFGTAVPPEAIADALRGLHAEYGVYAVLGNTDWWTDGLHIWQQLENAGIPVLENQAQRIETPDGPLWIAGVADDMSRSPDTRGTIAQAAQGDPVIVITHEPAIWPDVPSHVALTLAGHTHGGQIYLPLFGALIIPGRTPLRQAYGHIREDGKNLYVTSGLGTSILPVRFNMPPEVAVITLGAKGSP